MSESPRSVCEVMVGELGERLLSVRLLDRQALVKSSLMLGLGETLPQVVEALHDLRAAGVDWLTLGQYLRPTRKHLPVERFVTPQEFADLEAQAREIGFPLVNAGPLVRSSYRAAEGGAQQLHASRCQAAAGQAAAR